jgi:hypothetical protein
MKTVVIADGHILVDDRIYVPLDWEAFSIDGEIGIRHLSHPDIHLFKGRVLPSEISLEGVVYATALEFVYAFNARTAAALSYLLPSMKANTDYPSNFASQQFAPSAVTPEMVIPIPAIGRSGYVTITALEANGGVIYVGESDVSAISYHLEAGKSVTIELADLGNIYVLAASAGDEIGVLIAYKD